MSEFLKALEALGHESRTSEAMLRAQYEEFRARAEAAEQECLRLRQEIQDVGACLRKVRNDIGRSSGNAADRTPAPAPAQVERPGA